MSTVAVFPPPPVAGSATAASARVLAEAAAILPLVAGVLDGDGAHFGSIIGPSPSLQHFSGQSGPISAAIRSPSAYSGLASPKATCAWRHFS